MSILYQKLDASIGATSLVYEIDMNTKEYMKYMIHFASSENHAKQSSFQRVLPMNCIKRDSVVILACNRRISRVDSNSVYGITLAESTQVHNVLEALKTSKALVKAEKCAFPKCQDSFCHTFTRNS